MGRARKPQPPAAATAQLNLKQVAKSPSPAAGAPEVKPEPGANSPENGASADAGDGAPPRAAAPLAPIRNGTPTAPRAAKPPLPRKAEHAHSTAHRRGPMDEMRQLCRILVNIIPRSQTYFGKSGIVAPAGGGNKIKEGEIRSYINEALGEAPPPTWALPEGWGDYVAGLFNWALGEDAVTGDQARQCASRSTGRPWTAHWDEIHALGVYPDLWEAPLKTEQVRKVQAEVRAGALISPAVAQKRPPKRTRAPPAPPTQQKTRRKAPQCSSAAGSDEAHALHAQAQQGLRAQHGGAPAREAVAALAGDDTAVADMFECAAALHVRRDAGDQLELPDLGQQLQFFDHLKALFPEAWVAASHADTSTANAVFAVHGRAARNPVGPLSPVPLAPTTQPVLWKDSPSQARLGPKNLCAPGHEARPGSQQRLDFEAAVDTVKSTQEVGGDAELSGGDRDLAAFLATQRSQESQVPPFSQFATLGTQSQCSLPPLSQIGPVAGGSLPLSQADELLAGGERMGGGGDDAAAQA